MIAQNIPDLKRPRSYVPLTLALKKATLGIDFLPHKLILISSEFLLLKSQWLIHPKVKKKYKWCSISIFYQFIIFYLYSVHSDIEETWLLPWPR